MARSLVDTGAVVARGQDTRSSNDCLIARIAIENALILLHDDRDFESISAVAPELRLYPVQ